MSLSLGGPGEGSPEDGSLRLQLLPEDQRLTSPDGTRGSSRPPGRSFHSSHRSPFCSPVFARLVSQSVQDATRVVERSQHVATAPEQGETLLGTSLKVITSGLGAGILAAPWGAAGASLTVATLITGVVLVFNMWTTMIIVHAIDRWGGSKVWDPDSRRFIGSTRRPGYRIDDLGQLLRQAPWPLPLLATAWDLTVNMSNFGCLVGYMIVTGDALTPLVAESAPGLASRQLSIVVGSLACLPLCWADLAFLTYSSAVGVASNVFLFAVLLNALHSGGRSDGVCAVGVSSGALTCASNIVFSVIVQMCIPEYYTQLRRDDQDPDKFFKWVLLPSFGFIFILMCSFAAVGYLAFGPGVQSNVLKDLEPDVWAKCTQFAMVITCVMVYPNMVRPMVQPLLRAKEYWLRLLRLLRDPDFTTPITSPNSPPVRKWTEGKSRAGSFGGPVECGINVELMPDIYEGRLVHTEICGPIIADPETGEATLEVLDTTGFVKDDLIFIDGPARDYAVIKEVSSAPPNAAQESRGPGKHGCILLRPRFNEHSLLPQVPPPCALTNTALEHGTKVVLDQDPALLTAAVVGEQCIQVSFFVGIMRGAGIVIGEGARAERHRVASTKVFRPAASSAEAHLRTHDLVLYLEKGLRHNHGARTRVVLDHGGVEGVATLIVMCVMVTAFGVTDLGLVNALNGALSVAIIMGIVPGALAFYSHEYWARGIDVEATRRRTMPLSIKFRPLSLMLAVAGVVVGIAAVFFTDNDSAELAASCSLLA